MTFYRFSSSEEGRVDASEKTREVFEPVMNLFVDRISNSPLWVDMTVRVLPGVAVATYSSSPLSGTRTAAHIAADGDDDLTIVTVLKGSMLARQKGLPDRMVTPGSAAVWDNERQGKSFTDHVTAVNIAIPRVALVHSVADLDRAFRDCISPKPALKLLTGYIQSLTQEIGALTPEDEALAAVHLRDLAALVLGPTRDAAEIASGRGVRAARLKAIKDHIEKDLAEGSLSLESVARRHGISPRYVRALFEMEDTSFTDYVLNARLARAHRMLADPRFKSRSISTIAFDVGFNDLSYFGRAFRRRYGMTPTDARVLLTSERH